jgi:hypothetical protein
LEEYNGSITTDVKRNVVNDGVWKPEMRVTSVITLRRVTATVVTVDFVLHIFSLLQYVLQLPAHVRNVLLTALRGGNLLPPQSVSVVSYRILDLNFSTETMYSRHMLNGKYLYSLLVEHSNFILLYEVDGACSTYGGGERCIQDFGGETRGKETTWKTQT